MILHGYWRSGAAYRTPIALALKGLAYEQAGHVLRTGAQKAPPSSSRGSRFSTAWQARRACPVSPLSTVTCRVK